MTRKQCAKCPWKKSTNPHDIPGGYCETKHSNLRNTIAAYSDSPGLIGGQLKIMACHETAVNHELPCVGWLYNQLGPGNNIPLRLAMRGNNPRLSADFEVDGPQHETFEDTLPKSNLQSVNARRSRNR